MKNRVLQPQKRSFAFILTDCCQQEDRAKCKTKKSEKLSFLASVPPQVVPEVAQSAYNRDF